MGERVGQVEKERGRKQMVSYKGLKHRNALVEIGFGGQRLKLQLISETEEPGGGLIRHV